jgi:MoaA/NifB/PqqE/SkfB family radical SAM enzyme
MIINIFLNNYLSYSPPKTLVHMDYNVLKPLIQNPEHTYVLRGEPTLYPYLFETLDQLQGKNFILTTDGYDPDVLLRYKKPIPYISFNYDGFMNDKIRNHDGLTNNIIHLLGVLQGKTETLRLAYTVSHANMNWVDADMEILLKLWKEYGMKQPYFSVVQQGDIYSVKDFIWIGINDEYLQKVNSKGLLTQSNYDYLKTYLAYPSDPCISPQTNTVVAWDGTVRMCMSHRLFESLGDLRNSTFAAIMEESKTKREGCATCAYKTQCWLSHHLKDNISL